MSTNTAPAPRNGLFQCNAGPNDAIIVWATGKFFFCSFLLFYYITDCVSLFFRLNFALTTCTNPILLTPKHTCATPLFPIDMGCEGCRLDLGAWRGCQDAPEGWHTQVRTPTSVPHHGKTPNQKPGPGPPNDTTCTQPHEQLLVGRVEYKEAWQGWDQEGDRRRQEGPKRR